MSAFFTVHWALVAAIWYLGNGLLHDIFVLRAYKEKYDRELLRLLMDGHVLMLSGAMTFVSYRMMDDQIPFGGLIGVIASSGMLIYCAMIFPFLKSIMTIIISIVLFCVSISHLQILVP